QATVDLVRGNLKVASDMKLPSRIQQHLRSHDISTHKWRRIVNAPVHMALGGKVDDGAHPFAHDPANSIRIVDITLDNAIPGIGGYTRQVGKVASVAEPVIIDHRDSRILGQQVVDKVTTNETTTARYEHPIHADSPISISFSKKVERELATVAF